MQARREEVLNPSTLHTKTAQRTAWSVASKRNMPYIYYYIKERGRSKIYIQTVEQNTFTLAENMSHMSESL